MRLVRHAHHLSNEVAVLTLAIGICVASVLFVAIAGYFYAQNQRKNANNNFVDENSRLINSGK